MRHEEVCESGSFVANPNEGVWGEIRGRNLESATQNGDNAFLLWQWCGRIHKQFDSTKAHVCKRRRKKCSEGREVVLQRRIKEYENVRWGCSKLLSNSSGTLSDVHCGLFEGVEYRHSAVSAFIRWRDERVAARTYSDTRGRGALSSQRANGRRRPHPHNKVHN